jgi:hypothetical protein
MTLRHDCGQEWRGNVTAENAQIAEDLKPIAARPG